MFMSEYQIYLDHKYPIQCLQLPKKLIWQLDPSNPQHLLQQFINNITAYTPSALQVMRRLTLLSLLIHHSDKFYTVTVDVLPLNFKCHPSQKWIEQNFLIPFQKFLLKCCSSFEMYEVIKKNSHYLDHNTLNLQTLFYIINLLNQFFTTVEKISSLGRYYLNSTRYTTINYVHMASTQALTLYVSLRKIIQEMVMSPQIYIKTKQDQKLMKTILGQSLISLNEEMKNLFLNKYYQPFKNGYKTKLFRNEEQNQKASKTINGILNSHRDTQRQNKYKAKEISMLGNHKYNTTWNSSVNFNNSFHPNIFEYSLSNFQKTLATPQKKPIAIKKKSSFTIEVQQQLEDDANQQIH